jgi:hypothetical protein
MDLAICDILEGKAFCPHLKREEITGMCMKRINGVVGYQTEDGQAYCMECIRKNYDLLKGRLEGAVIGNEFEENRYVCAGCQEEIG